ncbi:uncharacterized protein LOC141724643 [Apium graveolens]|uniref:uncharacterized protein LOC141724643 n=1 Tax=Apium graveolens TaxID=4045 RepID=UPI003D792140
MITTEATTIVEDVYMPGATVIDVLQGEKPLLGSLSQQGETIELGSSYAGETCNESCTPLELTSVEALISMSRTQSQGVHCEVATTSVVESTIVTVGLTVGVSEKSLPSQAFERGVNPSMPFTAGFNTLAPPRILTSALEQGSSYTRCVPERQLADNSSLKGDESVQDFIAGTSTTAAIDVCVRETVPEPVSDTLHHKQPNQSVSEMRETP